jgi:hypothetical protein
MDELRLGVQQLCQNIAPLGATMDYFREDLDSMNKELEMWQMESKKYRKQLENEKK